MTEQNTDAAERGACSQTIKEFCVAERISVSTYYALKRSGLAPDELHITPKTIRITPEAHRDWRALMQERAKSEAATLEIERRRGLAVVAGKRAAESADHVSRRPPKRKRG